MEPAATHRNADVHNEVHGIAHFRVEVGEQRFGIGAISALHDLCAGEADPTLRMAVTLRRAVTRDRRLYEWYRRHRDGKEAAQSVIISLLHGPGGAVVNRWQLDNARPVRWTGPEFDALANAVACEQLELCYDAIRWLDD